MICRFSFQFESRFKSIGQFMKKLSHVPKNGYFEDEYYFVKITFLYRPLFCYRAIHIHFLEKNNFFRNKCIYKKIFPIENDFPEILYPYFFNFINQYIQVIRTGSATAINKKIAYNCKHFRKRFFPIYFNRYINFLYVSFPFLQK